jgi:hypothetical protein
MDPAGQMITGRGAISARGTFGAIWRNPTILFVALCAVVLACSPLFVSQAAAASLGGAYFIDDAEIEKVGNCEVEHWASFARNGDRVLVSNPACVADLGRPVELGVTVLRTKSAGDWDTTAAATAKTVFKETDGHGWGYGLSGAITYDTTTNLLNGLIVNVPVSYDFSKALRMNFNVGWQYDPSQRQNFLTGGAAFAWQFRAPFSLLGEVFAIVGPDQSNPRMQLGLRYNPVKSVDLDLIYGRNITGERSNWITVGLNFRTGQASE